MNTGVRKVVGGRACAAVLGLVAGVALLLPASPALAQTPGSTGDVIVATGTPIAFCPTGTPAAFAPESGTVGAVTVNGSGSCTPTSAKASGFYSVGTSASVDFTAECSDGVGRSGVVVPAGTSINGGPPVAAPTLVTDPATVTFPNGQTATLNQITTSGGVTTVTAIAFTGGPIIGRAVCGVAAYPLAVGSIEAPGPAPALPSPISGSEGGPVNNLVLLGGGLAIVVLLAQMAVARRVRRNQGEAAG